MTREILQTQGFVGAMVLMTYRAWTSVPLGSLSTLVLRIWAAQPICRKEGKGHSHSVKNPGLRGAGVASAGEVTDCRAGFAKY
jgi:hypothetical protein